MRRDGGVQVRRILWTWRVFILVCLSVCISGRTCHASEETGYATGETVSVSRSDKESSLEHSDPELWEEMQERLLEAFDFTEMDEGMEQILPGEKRTFRDVLDPLLSGELETAWEMAKQYLYDQFSFEFRSNKKQLVSMLLLAVTAALFSNFASALQNKQISRISFYVLYMLLITLCLNTFRVAMSGIENRVEVLVDFMRVLCPGYFLAVAFASGSSSALMFYNLVLILIYLVEVLILKFLLPMIHVYIMVQVMNYFVGEDLLTELGELLKKLILWILKTLLALVVGINVVQGLLGPAIDGLKRSAVTKTVEAIPGIGNTFGSMTDVVLGTTVLIKNGIGMAGAVILLAGCLVPVVQMAVLTFFYKLAAALVQPVSDKRITGCISSVSSGYELLLKVLCTVLVLFLLTIAVAAAATS